MTQTPAVARGPGKTESAPGRERPAGRDLRWPAVVAAAYTVIQLVLVVPGTGLGWDETVYVSQVTPGADAAFFSAPRSRGITYLVAPVTALTSSVEALRVYLALLSGAGLFLALWVWRRLLPARVLALAGALFGGLWITVFYGPQVMPNLWVALGALFTVGCFLRAVRNPPDRAAPLALLAGVAFVALMRPSDAFWLAAPLAVVALVLPAWRRPVLLSALAAGMAVGCAPWIVEAYLGYDGLLARLRRASEIQGHLGPHLAFDDQLRSLEGRSLCRPCDVPWRRPVTAVWWFVLPLFVAAGCAVATRTRRPSAVLVPTLTGLSLAVPYLLLIDYAAPRFLLPAYALLALPAALCLTRLAALARPRPLLAAVLALMLAGHLAIQYSILNGTVSRNRANRLVFDRIAAELHRRGVRAPCVVSGAEAPRIAFVTGCASRQTGGHDGSITPAGLAALAHERPVAFVVTGEKGPPAYAKDWRVQRLPDLPGLHNSRAYLAPSARPAQETLPQSQPRRLNSR